jgi:hypothetical protein
MSSDISVSCHSCEKVLEFEAGQKIFKSDECDHCYADLRVCKMCDFYDTSSYNDCRESSAPRIVDKTKANFCDFFRLTNSNGTSNAKDDLMSAADALFKK